MTPDRDTERLFEEAHDTHADTQTLRIENLELKLSLYQAQAQVLHLQLRQIEEEFNRTKAQYDALKGKHEQAQG
jgi:hypothetical protein